MRLVAGQRMWSRDNRWDGYSEVTVRKVGRVWVHMSDGRRARLGGRYLNAYDGTWYVTDAERAEREAAALPGMIRGQIRMAVDTADLPTLNTAAAAFGIPPVVAWTPEKT